MPQRSIYSLYARAHTNSFARRLLIHPGDGIERGSRVSKVAKIVCLRRLVKNLLNNTTATARVCIQINVVSIELGFFVPSFDDQNPATIDLRSFSNQQIETL